jgi:formylglycine-generating enzyme required for sulfatase activity
MVLAGLAALLVAAGARADDLETWRAGRQAAFSAFQAAHPAAATEAAAFKQTALALEAAAGPGLATDPDLPPRIWQGADHPVELWDGPDAPPMVVTPPGEYTAGPAPTDAELRGNEPPRRRARVGQALAVAKYPITVGEFANFTAETGHDAGNQCWTFEDEDGHIRQGRNWRNPGFAQTYAHPVLCVSRADVEAYRAWLSKKTGYVYRLLSETEYEYVNRAGATTAFWWGQDAGSNRANCDGCNSLWDNRRTSPVGSFAANPFGLFDTTGDTWVWTDTCYVDPKAPAPAPPGGGCAEYVIRGGAWHGVAAGMRVFSRFHHTPDTHSATLGFRLAREL